MERDVDNTKTPSPVKKSNGVDCNGITEHQPDSNEKAIQMKGLSSNPVEPELEKPQKVVNGFYDPCKDKPEQSMEGSAACENSIEPNVQTVGENSSNSAVDCQSETASEMESSENKLDHQSTGTCKMSSDRDLKTADCGPNHVERNEEQMETGLEKNEYVVLREKENGDKCGLTGIGLNEVKNAPASAEKFDQSRSKNGDSAALAVLGVKSSDVNEKIEKAETKEHIKPVKSQMTADVPSKAKESKFVERLESSSDDIEIIGESFTQTPSNQSTIFMNSGLQAVNNVPFQASFSSNSNASLPAMANMQNAVLLQNMRMPGIKTSLIGSMVPPGPGQYVFPGNFSSPQSMSLLNNSHAPPTPKSSMDQIELIRWEIQNRINVRPKYFKPNPTSELGPLAKFLFDIGSDLIKESVYHDLVKIQSKKNDDDKLTEKERDDLAKLKEIEKDLQATIGHLKLRFKKRCQGCGFQTESNSVLYFHKQFPHEDNKNLKCAYCSFSTKQSMAFKFHMEAEHAIQGKLHDKKAFFECHMCPYENNQEQKLILHRERCLKQFRPLFNLHPSCLSGAEINLCLENIFYKPLVPKNLKLLQQKHAQQQAALAEAKRQQAQMQMIAAQKNAAALAAKKQQQQLQQQHLQQQLQLQKQRQLPNIAPRFNSNVNPRTQSLLPRQNLSQQQPTVRYNSKSTRPTVANMLNNKTNNGAMSVQNSTPGGFEVCEICGGYVKDRKALRIHFFYAHRIDLPFNLFERNQAPLYCATCYVRFWTAQGLRKHIDTHKEENQTRGVVGKCISCGHHVLNLLLHMRIVHNRELQHYINALMCMFCGGHFSSRQDCERHIIKTHGNVDPVSGTLKSPPLASQITGSQGTSSSNVKAGSGAKKSPSVRASGTNSLVKGSVCVLCNLNFGRNVDLTRHCMRMHHTCMKCGMVVIDKASLLKHTCLTSPSGTRDCGMCGESGFHPAYYVKHLRDKHLRKFSIKVAKVAKDVIERWIKRPYPFENDVLVEISDSDDESLSTSSTVHERRPTSIYRSPAKKPKIGPACSKIKKALKKPKIGPASKIGRRSLTVKAELGGDVLENGPNSNLKETGDKADKLKSESASVFGDGESKSVDESVAQNQNKSMENKNSVEFVEGKAKQEISEEKESQKNGAKAVDSEKDKGCEIPQKPEKRKSLDREISGSDEKRIKSDPHSA